MLYLVRRPFRFSIVETSLGEGGSAWCSRRGCASAHGSHKRNERVAVLRAIANYLKAVASKLVTGARGWLRRWFGRWFHWLPLRSTVISGSREALRYEAHRIVQWRAVGLPAPRLLALGDDFILTADGGSSILRWLARDSTTPHRINLLEIVAHALGRVHCAGLCHGCPVLRNIAFDGFHVTFLNLNDLPVVVMPLAAAQARDLLFFLVSAAGVLPPAQLGPCLRTLWAAYLRGCPPPSSPRKMLRLLEAPRRVSRPLRLLPCRWLGQSTERTIRLLKSIAQRKSFSP